MTTLKKGSRGNDVKTLQQKLNLIPDGIFGPITEEAVKSFQKSKGLVVDGIVGAKTWAAMGVVATTRFINEIVLHCTATPEGRDYSVAQIKAGHLARGFSDIGYHFVIGRDGKVYPGRAISEIGAHATNHNAHSIGISYVGGLSTDGKTCKDTRTPAQVKSMHELVANLCREYPITSVIGHRDTSPDLNHDGKITPNEWIKGCPCFDAIPEFSKYIIKH